MNYASPAPRIADSSKRPDPVHAQCEKIAFDTQNHTLRSLKTVLTSAHRLVQIRHPNRAQSKIIEEKTLGKSRKRKFAYKATLTPKASRPSDV
jgi:hypothetical protein